MMGETLVNMGIITLKELDKALDLQRTTGGKLGDTIVKLGFATKDEINKALENN